MEEALASCLLAVLVPALMLIGFVKYNKPDSDKLTIVTRAYREKGGKLLDLLRRARDEMLQDAGEISIFSTYDTYKAFADHIALQVSLIEQNDADPSPDAASRFKAGLYEVYLIFLPTSDWDEANGSATIANEILETLKEILGK